jgi:uncharacterized protein
MNLLDKLDGPYIAMTLPFPWPPSKRLNLMLIDLSRLPEDAEVAEVYDPDWWQSDRQDEQVLGLDAPLEVKVRVHRAGDKYILDGRVRGGILVRCDRCLESFHRDVDSPFHLFLRASFSDRNTPAEVELLDEDLEVDFIHGEQINLDEIVREQLFLSLPMKCICREDCRGLCLLCGGNLNLGTCTCRKDEGRSAFSKLKDTKINDHRGA